MTTKTARKKNPADLTLRNNNARKREIAELRKRVSKLEAIVNCLLSGHYWGKPKRKALGARKK